MNMLRAHFDDKEPVILTTDSSSYGAGGVILQKHPDGREQMNNCAFKTLSTAERRYSQIEKEALGIVFNFKHFQQFLAGRQVLLYTDQQPLTFIFKPEAEISTNALHRIQRWSMYLANFSYIVHHLPGKSNFQADAHFAFVETSSRGARH